MCLVDVDSLQSKNGRKKPTKKTMDSIISRIMQDDMPMMQAFELMTSAVDLPNPKEIRIKETK